MYVSNAMWLFLLTMPVFFICYISLFTLIYFVIAAIYLNVYMYMYEYVAGEFFWYFQFYYFGKCICPFKYVCDF